MDYYIAEHEELQCFCKRKNIDCPLFFPKPEMQKRDEIVDTSSKLKSEREYYHRNFKRFESSDLLLKKTSFVPYDAYNILLAQRNLGKRNYRYPLRFPRRFR